MTGGEKVAVGVGAVVVVGGAGFAIWYLWNKRQQQNLIARVSGQPASSSNTSSVGNIIAGIGGGAVAQLGKEGGTYLADRLRSAFS